VDAVAPGILFHGHYHLRHTAERPLPNGGHTRVVGLSSDRESVDDNWVIVDISGESGIALKSDLQAAQQASPRLPLGV
jgi:hypothetical protein